MNSMVTQALHALGPSLEEKIIIVLPDAEDANWWLFNNDLAATIEHGEDGYCYSVMNPRTGRILSKGVAEQLESVLETAAKELGDTTQWRVAMKAHLLTKAGLQPTDPAQ